MLGYAARFFYYFSLGNQREFIRGKADLAENDNIYKSSDFMSALK
jgi:hypothetical protein